MQKYMEEKKMWKIALLLCMLKTNSALESILKLLYSILATKT